MELPEIKSINCGIYKITSPTGRVYIGKSVNLKKRYRQYFSTNSFRTQKVLCNSLNKYGMENHTFEVIEYSENKNILNEREIFWINFYQSNICRYSEIGGMNCTDGGEGVTGRVLSAESRAKISKSNTGKVSSAETRKKISVASKGRPAWNKGKTNYLTEEQRVQMSNSSKGRKATQETKDKMSKVNKGRKYPKEFGEKIRLRMMGNQHGLGKIKSEELRNLISKIHKGKKLTNETKEKLRVANIGKKQSSETIEKRISKMSGGLSVCSKLILDIETGVYYDCIADAAFATNRSRGSVGKYLRGDNNKTNLKYA